MPALFGYAGKVRVIFTEICWTDILGVNQEALSRVAVAEVMVALFHGALFKEFEGSLPAGNLDNPVSANLSP